MISAQELGQGEKFLWAVRCNHFRNDKYCTFWRESAEKTIVLTGCGGRAEVGQKYITVDNHDITGTGARVICFWIEKGMWISSGKVIASLALK